MTDLRPTFEQSARTINQPAPRLATRQERKLFAEGKHGRSAPKKLPAASSSSIEPRYPPLIPAPFSSINAVRHLNPPNSIPISHLSTRNSHLQKWTHLSSQSSSSRSPASWAVPVRRNCPVLAANKAVANHRTMANSFLLGDRLSRWCHPGSRRVHGRPDPIDHPKRQGTRYEQPSPEQPTMTAQK